MFTALGWLWPAAASGSHILMFHWELHLAAEAFVAAATNSWALPSRYFREDGHPGKPFRCSEDTLSDLKSRIINIIAQSNAIKMYESHSKPTSAQI